MEPRTLVISDVDGTLLGDDDALLRFYAWRVVQGPRVVLAYASGRFCSSLAASVKETILPEPDYLIGGVGTQLRRFDGCESVGEWERVPIESWNGPKVRRVLSTHPRLMPQPDVFQSERKVSYYYYNAAPEELAKVVQVLQGAGIIADVIYSSARDLDVVPHGVNKGSAAAYLARRLGVGRVIACGDTGNDAPLMCQGFCGVVVGNALPELRAHCSERIYLSPHTHADGVLDGIRYWSERQERSGR
ncbi:MAG: HAD-IIB family hydrolase [Pirellulales bacterium]